ncbi:MAG TPA: VOC family protein [Stackebrandtia sp.]|jgi:catechol 2,3-dioxygenase-like lactoylglutathione lyase family enzyme|uniref:VOC family protein n=1 Tax=Stackebrandtia sp. TaxID=2023065 RepID=UPI002D2DB363|nr:VOC family protein [Stackebrandtia sp.]HZE42070.1 VOC family protein [Stackebrandtia sp.]
MSKRIEIVIDCPDTIALADFYAAVGDATKVADDYSAEWATLDFDGFKLAFQHVDGYRAPEWPGQEHPQQFHVDLFVDDLEVEGRRAIELGATFKLDQVREDGYGFVVYLDPAGHPFCLCRENPGS